MKRFAFSLDRVREWREKQVAVEEAQLEQLFSAKLLVERRRELLEGEARESASLVAHSAAIEAADLQALDAFRRYVIAQRTVIAAKLAECDSRIAEQQRKLMEARRKFELLDRLKARKWKAWNADFAREIESQAGEMYLAKWKRGPQ